MIKHITLHDLRSSFNIIKVITSTNIRWTEHAAQTGEMENAYKILV